MDAFDAVVVGAGMNGLAAAIHLLSRGWSVAVIEQAAEPGGAVKTREVTLPGFRHDLCAMNLSLFAGSPFFAAYKEELTAQGLAFAPAADCFASVFRDHGFLGVSKDLDKTLAGIAALSAKDAAAWRTMVDRFGEDAPHLFALLGSPMPSLASLRAVWGAWRTKGSAFLVDLGRLLVSTPRDFLDAHFEEPKVKAMMAAWGMHLDFPPDVAGGALFPYLEFDGEPGLRHGHRARRSGRDRQGDDRPYQGEGRRDQAQFAGRKDRSCRQRRAWRPARRRDADCGEEGGRRQPASADRVRPAHGSRA